MANAPRLASKGRRARPVPASPCRPCFYVLIGIPGSGKSTYARKNYPGAIRISLDDLRKMMTWKDFEVTVEPAVAAAGQAIIEVLSSWASGARRDVLFDATNVSRKRRGPLIETAKRFGFKPVAVYVACPLKIALARNARRSRQVPEDVIERFYDDLQPPSLTEGFEQVIVIDSTLD